MHEATLDITIEGNLKDFLGVNTEKKAEGTTHFNQPHIIDQILKVLRLEDKNVMKNPILEPSSKFLSRNSEVEAFNGYFNKRSVIGKCNYLENIICSDIVYITHQCERLSTNPK